MPDQNLGHRKTYIQTDKLYFLYVFSQAFRKQASNPKKDRLIKNISFNLYNRQFRPPKNKCVAQYVIWLFDTCGIAISNLTFPKGFFKESNELSGSDKLRWDLFSWRLNKATKHCKPIDMRNISFEYDIDEASQKTNEYLDSYLNRIENDQITSASHYIAFKKQKEEIINKIREKYLKTGKKNVFFELEEVEYPKGTNFVEMFIILEKEGYLKLTRFNNKYQSAVFAVQDKLIKSERNSFRIEFKEDGNLIEKSKNILIHKYDVDDRAYEICVFLFRKHKSKIWFSWDEIYDAIHEETDQDTIEKAREYEAELGSGKYLMSDEHPPLKDEDKVDVIKRRKSISDSIRAINQYAKKAINHEIIETKGKKEYQALF